MTEYIVKSIRSNTYAIIRVYIDYWECGQTSSGVYWTNSVDKLLQIDSFAKIDHSYAHWVDGRRRILYKTTGRTLESHPELFI